LKLAVAAQLVPDYHRDDVVRRQGLENRLKERLGQVEIGGEEDERAATAEIGGGAQQAAGTRAGGRVPPELCRKLGTGAARMRRRQQEIGNDRVVAAHEAE